MSVSRIEAGFRDPAAEKGRKLRRDGFVPAVIYGHKDETKNIKINHNEIRNLIVRHGTKAKLELALGDATYSAFIKEIQRDVITSDIVSIGLQMLYQDEVLKIEIPLSFHNTSSLVEYIFNEDMSSIEVEALPMYLPERIDVDVEGITPDKPIRVKDLSICSDANIKVLENPESIVASAHFKKEMVIETEAAEAEPELIGASAAEEEEKEKEKEKGKDKDK
jgi:large subunit ribosomal protein L25